MKHAIAFVLLLSACCLCGCKTYYENAGLRVRTGNVTAPVEVSEPTSSANAKFLFFMDGADVYVAKGYGVTIDYSASYGGTWLTSASTQGVHVVVSPTNAAEIVKAITEQAEIEKLVESGQNGTVPITTADGVKAEVKYENGDCEVCTDGSCSEAK